MSPIPLAQDDATHILVVDDDRRIRSLLGQYLAQHGYRVTHAEDSRIAAQKMALWQFDLLIVDVMMPGQSGLEFAGSTRKSNDVPIIMLTARSEPEHRIEGLETGVDDYLTKPFEPRELLLRVKSVLRRRGLAQPAEQTIIGVSFGAFSYYFAKAVLKNAGKPVRLTDRERDMLTRFGKRGDRIIARNELTGPDGNERSVDVQINRLRRKIETDPSEPVHLLTVRGLGYRLVCDQIVGNE